MCAAAGIGADQHLPPRLARTERTAVTVDIDATLVTAFSEKEQAAATWKKTYGFHR